MDPGKPDTRRALASQLIRVSNPYAVRLGAALTALSVGMAAPAFAEEVTSSAKPDETSTVEPTPSAESAPDASSPEAASEATTDDTAQASAGESEESAEESEESEEDATEELPPPRLLDAALGMRLYARSFRYSDTLAQVLPARKDPDLPAYGLAAAPMPYVEVGVFPGAGSKSVVLQNIGVVGGFEVGIATNINYAGTTLDQTHYRYHVGLKGRIPIGRVSIQPVVEYGGHEFSIRARGGAVAPFPSVSYSMIEAGSDVVWQSHPVTIRAYGRFLAPFQLGDVGSSNWFPSAKALGTSWGGQVGFAVSPAFDILANFDARVYGLNFNPVSEMATADKVAGGATDQYVSVSLGIGYHFPLNPSAE
jgi:hypothetical protein